MESLLEEKKKKGNGFLIAIWGKPNQGKTVLPHPGRYFMTTIKATCKVCRKKGDHYTIDGKNFECKRCKQVWEI